MKPILVLSLILMTEVAQAGEPLETPIEIQEGGRVLLAMETPWSGPSEGLVVSCHHEPGCISFKEAVKLALRQDPAYGRAKGKLVAGIVVTSVAGAAAVVLGFMALTTHWADEAFSGWGHGDGDDYQNENDTTARNLGIASLSALVVTLAVGLPVLVSGASDVRQIRSRVRRQLSMPRVGVTLGSRQAGLSMRWRF